MDWRTLASSKLHLYGRQKNSNLCAPYLWCDVFVDKLYTTVQLSQVQKIVSKASGYVHLYTVLAPVSHLRYGRRV